MTKFKQPKRFLILSLIGFFILSSCQKEESEFVSKDNLNTEVSIDLANKVALDFSKTKIFWTNPKNQNERLKPSASNEFTEKEIDNVYSISENSGGIAFYICDIKRRTDISFFIYKFL